MKLTQVPTFSSDEGHLVQFIKFKPGYNMPGFTHRVIIDRTSVGFLSEQFKPNAKAAMFFLNKMLGLEA